MKMINQPFCVLCWIAAAALAAFAVTVRGEDVKAERLPDVLQVVAIETVDLTRMAKAAASGKAVSVSSDGLLRASEDGAASVTYSYADQSVTVPVMVSGTGEPHPASFVRDVQPVLSKMGCNAGTCHGSKEGKGGFKLSLRGYDPLFDHRALTGEDPHIDRS